MTLNKHKETILFTGAGGYIGSVAVSILLEKGYKVKALDVFYWGLETLPKKSHAIEIIKADIRDINPKVLKGVKTVIHAAGLSNDPMADFNPKANFQINTTATINFAKLCKKNGVKKFIFASSASIYDRPDADKVLQDENSTVSPIAAYSLSKHKAEIGIRKLMDKNFSPIIFRQGTVYGYSPRLRYDLVVNTMVKDAMQNKIINVYCRGMQWRPLIDVKDVARAYIAAIEADSVKLNGQILNLLYKNYTIIELSRHIKKILKQKFKIDVKIKVYDSKSIGRNYKISGEKAKKLLNWQPRFSVEDAVEDLVKNITKNKNTDFNHPRYYNIEWMKLLLETQQILSFSKKIF